ncbi:tetratricopeptide repeat protein [Desulfomarina sp.]
MRKSFFHSVPGLFLVLFFLFPPPPVQAGNHLPITVQLVLSRLAPLLEKEDYKKGVELLQTFRQRCTAADQHSSDHDTVCFHPEITFNLGNCYLFLKQYDKAVDAYRQAVKRDPDHSSAWLNLARALYEKGTYSEAASSFMHGYETGGSKDPQILYYAGACRLMSGENKMALEILERLFSSHPGSIKAEWKEYMVHALLATDQPVRALPFIKELARDYRGKKQIRWQEILLYHYLRLDMGKKALALARRLAARSPSVSKWWKALTHIHLNRGEYRQGLTALTIYSFLTPLDEDEKKLCGDLNLQLGIPVRALPIYEEILTKKMDKQLLQQIVTIYIRQGRDKEALEYLNAVSLGPKDLPLLRLKGELLYTLKKFRQAEKVFNTIAGIDRKHAGPALMMAGYAAWHAGDTQRAITILKKRQVLKNRKSRQYAH